MANKEKLEQLADYINKLTKLAESIYEREIYPVSFFSQAYDVTNKIQESLHQIEIEQIELFERQMKEHQDQIQSIQQLKQKTESSEQSTRQTQRTKPVSDNNTTQVEYEMHLAPALKNNTEENSKKAQIILQTEIDHKQLSEIDSINNENEKKSLSDLRKALTLNDRFRFCRELFSSNESLMNQTYSELNSLESYNSSVNYIKNHFNWDLDVEIVTEFMMMLEKRFE